jgi:hypothetical protein
MLAPPPSPLGVCRFSLDRPVARPQVSLPAGHEIGRPLSRRPVGGEPIAFRLPGGPWGRRWLTVFDTRDAMFHAGNRTWDAGTEVEVEGRSVVVLRRVR